MTHLHDALTVPRVRRYNERAMARTPRKTTKRSLKSRLQQRLSRSVRAVQQRLAARTRRTTRPARMIPPGKAATSPGRSGRASARPVAAKERLPRLPPSKRAPHRGTLTTARPAVGAPPTGSIAPGTLPPLTTSLPGISAASAPPVTASPSLPPRYGVTTLVLLIRDPWWLYAYWEVTQDRASTVQRMMNAEERAHAATVLRLYDVTGAPDDLARAHRTLDVVLTHDVDNWFIDTGEANRTWVAELGYRTASGRWVTLVRSNVVTTPRAGPSDQFDEAWMTTDEAYWKLLGVVYGLGFGTSSFEIRQLLERRFRDVMSSARGSAQPPASGGAGAPLVAR